MHVDDNEDQVGNHREVFLVVVDLGLVQRLDGVRNALCLWSQRDGKLGTARPYFRLEKPRYQSGLGSAPSIFT